MTPRTLRWTAALVLAGALAFAAFPAEAARTCARPDPYVTTCADAEGWTATVETAPIFVASAVQPSTTTTVRVDERQDALATASVDYCLRAPSPCYKNPSGAGPGEDGALRAYVCTVTTGCLADHEVTRAGDVDLYSCAWVYCGWYVDAGPNHAYTGVGAGACTPLLITTCAGAGWSVTPTHAGASANLPCEGVALTDCWVAVSGNPHPGGAMTVTTVPPGPCVVFCVALVDTWTVHQPEEPGGPVRVDHSDCLLLCVSQTVTAGPDGASVGTSCLPYVCGPGASASASAAGAALAVQQACIGLGFILEGCPTATVAATPGGEVVVRENVACTYLLWETCPAYAEVAVTPGPQVCESWDAHLVYSDRWCLP